MKTRFSTLLLSSLLALSLVLGACAPAPASSKPESSASSAIESSEASVTESSEASVEESSEASVEESSEVSVEESSETSVEESSSAEESSDNESSVATVYPVTLKDMVGREVTIPAKPEKLVSGYAISTSALLGLGLGDNLVGIESKANTRPLYKLGAPALLDLPDVGTLKEVNLEAIAAAEPDLVILARKQKDAAESLTELGFSVLVVDPEDQERLSSMITLLGQATDHNGEAAKLNSYVDDLAEKLTDLLKDVETPTVYLGGNSAFLSTTPAGMYQSDLIKQAGGKNVADEIEGNDWVDISYEQLLAWNPDVIFISSAAKYTLEELEADASLKDLKALQEHRVFHLQNVIEAWDTPIPSAILGAYVMACNLHSDKLNAEKLVQVVTDYYEEFYGFHYEFE